MAWRTTQEDVRAIIDTGDEDAADEINVAPFIQTATALVDYVASKDTAGILTTALAEQLERYLAAFFYEFKDPQYASKATEGAKATFQGEYGLGFDLNKWGQVALRLDVTGTLAELNKPTPTATIEWLGKPPSEQTAYEDRN